MRGKHPVLVSGFSLFQQFPTVCPNCAGVVSTIGLRSFLLLSQRDWITFDPLLYFLGFWLYYIRKGGCCPFAESTTLKGIICTCYGLKSLFRSGTMDMLGAYKTSRCSRRNSGFLHAKTVGATAPTAHKTGYMDSGALILNIVRMLWITPRTARQSAIRPCCTVLSSASRMRQAL